MFYDSAGSVYPAWDMPGVLGEGGRLAPWCEALTMKVHYTPEKLEAREQQLEQIKRPKEIYQKYVDNIDVFMCPSDKPHPHYINQDRADTWGFLPHDYSYSINHFLTWGEWWLVPTIEHKNASGQILCIDGLWSWAYCFSAGYVSNPG